jgi:hypothetical protein
MTDYLGNLVSRARGLAVTVEPRVPSLYEPRADELAPELEEQPLTAADVAADTPVSPAATVQHLEERSAERPGPKEPAREPPVAARSTGPDAEPKPQVPADARSRVVPPLEGTTSARRPERVEPVVTPVPLELPTLPAGRGTAIVRPVVVRSASAAPPSSLPALPEAEPAVRVSIGRVEVRAIATVQPPPAPRRTPPQPTLSLDEYLERRRRERP